MPRLGHLRISRHMTRLGHLRIHRIHLLSSLGHLRILSWRHLSLRHRRSLSHGYWWPLSRLSHLRSRSHLHAIGLGHWLGHSRDIVLSLLGHIGLGHSRSAILSRQLSMRHRLRHIRLRQFWDIILTRYLCWRCLRGSSSNRYGRYGNLRYWRFSHLGHLGHFCFWPFLLNFFGLRFFPNLSRL